MKPVRFAVLCDTHVRSAGDVHSQYFAEALRQAAATSPDFLAILGDLTARGGPVALAAIAEMLATCPIKTLLLPGNSDVRDASVGQFQAVFGETRFSFQMEDILFLGMDTSDPAVGDEQRDWIATRVAGKKSGPCILFTHMPPHKLGKDSRAFFEGLLTKHPALLWVAGHSHRPGVSQFAGCEARTVGGVDPFKPAPIQPGFDLFTLSADGKVAVERRPITLVSEDHLASVFSRLGAAPRDFDSADNLIRFLDEHGLKHLQIKRTDATLRSSASLRSTSASAGLAPALDAWRRKTPGATLSVHLSTPQFDASGRLSNREALQREVDLALSLSAASVTAHLPKMDSDLVLDDHDRIKWYPFTEFLRRDFVALMHPLATNGCGIHLENLRWRGEGLKGARSLGTVPSHLLAFREALEALLPVGFTLDVGHAWGNGDLASKYPLFEWFEALQPCIRSVHLHDTVPREDKEINHQPIGADGGMINLEGTFYLLARLAPQAVVYLEMNNLPDVALSLDRMRAWAKEITSLASRG